ncbi:hypothetical protein ACQPUZ_04810 [Clostridium tertium]
MDNGYFNNRKSLSEISRYIIEEQPEEIWIISSNVIMARKFWTQLNKIEPDVFRKQKLRIISSRISCIDGLNPKNSIILMCGLWWKSPVYGQPSLDYYIKSAKRTFPISELP